MITPFHSMVKLSTRGEQMNLQSFVNLYNSSIEKVEDTEWLRIGEDGYRTLVVLNELISIGFISLNESNNKISIVDHWYESV